jgi:hypothetical protein
MYLHNSDQGGIEVVRFGVFGVQRFDRVQLSGYGEDGTAVEIFGEFFCIESG